MLLLGSAATTQAQDGCLPAGLKATSFKNHIVSIITDTSTPHRESLQDVGITDSLAANVYFVSNDSVCREAAKSWAAYDGVPYDSEKVYVVKIGTEAYVVYKPRNTPGKGYIPLYVCNQLFVHKGYLSW